MNWGPEEITIAVGGMRYTAFEWINVRAAFNEAARSFEFEVAAELGASATNAIFAEGTKVEIYANGDLLLTGYVDRRQPKLSATSATITVSGRSSSQDLIDGAAEHKTGRFENKTPDQIANELCSNYKGTGFYTDQMLEKLEQYQLTPGATVFREAEKMARAQGKTLTGTADGRIKITSAGGERHAGGLIEGDNIEEGSADHNASNRHSKYTVRGQRPFDHGVAALEIEGVINDSTIDRHRPVIIVQDEDTTKDRAKKRAKTRRDRAAGNGTKAQITTPGFRDAGGAVWEPGKLVWTESPFLDLAQDMLIESVVWRQEDGKGSQSTLWLVDPRAYGGAGGKGNKSGSGWSMDDSEAIEGEGAEDGV